MDDLETKKIMDDYYRMEDEQRAEEERVNVRILKSIKSVKGLDYCLDLEEYMEEAATCGAFSLVRKVKGHRQDEGHEIKEVWVDQYSVGDSGDSWAGTVSVELKKGMWLEMPFSM